MQDSNRFTEKCAKAGTAFSLDIHEKLHEEQTPYQKIEIFATKSFGNLMVIDGFIMLTERDNFIYHEMISHPTLFCHSKPRNVIIVGGGDCGSLLEVAKHNCVKQITQVEIDQRVTDLSLQYFPQLCVANNDPRVKLVFDDAISWIKKAPRNSIDLIIVDSTDPIGPAEGLFSTAFYKDCFHALKKNGLLVQQSESPLIHLESIIKPMHYCMLNAGFKKTQLLNFPQPVYPSGWWSATIASKDDTIHFFREQESKSLEFTTHYYNHAIHIACFASPQFVLEQLK